MMDSQFFQIKGLKKTFSDTNNDVLNGIDLSFNEGDFICVLGPSGCGKSTLLRCILGFETYEGEILLEGHPVRDRKRDCVMVFQDMNQLFPWKTVIGNITFALKIAGIKEAAKRNQMAMDYLAKVNLSGYEKYFPNQLSGGMKQRVAIARTLSLKPRIILMDEPFASLDAMTRNQLTNELQNIVTAEKRTVLFITHNIQEAILLGTRIIVMSKGGKIIMDVANTLPKPVSPSDADYGAMWQKLNDGVHGKIS